MTASKATDEIFSDESSFYGDEEETNRLETLVATYDPEPYWGEYHQNLLSTMQHNLQAPTKPSSSDVSMTDAPPPPRTIRQDRRGRIETVDQFLSRLPPSTTEMTTARPWIWTYNHHIPPTGEGDVPTLLRKGRELLQAYERESNTLRLEHDKSGAKTTSALTRKLNPLRRELEKDILALAQETGVTHGKWMLFPTPDEVDETWATIARAMDKGELGDTAKVAPNDGSGHSPLICVYTVDFADVEDVKRVAKKLVDLGLVGKGPRPIFYKSDAYTLLEITSKNDYGLKASMFSSRDVLGSK
ncbi:Protein of unknown function DUF1917 [Penicillium brevicompactum]|uniref:DUF1917-domain-containing protein n=1 Tax=Penicillium brevicompactum TaxID=5074 RepID=A0A9W9RCM1_PENBR|nr:Protein of unknown function DUF1917 [Penicillium brevicompactum]